MNPEVKQYIDHAAVETAQTQLLQAAQAGDVAVATQKLNMLQQSLERVGADPGFIQQTVSTMRLQLKDAGNAARDRRFLGHQEADQRHPQAGAAAEPGGPVLIGCRAVRYHSLR